MRNKRLYFIVTLIVTLLSASGASSKADTAPPDGCSGTLAGAISGGFKCVMVAGYGFKPGVTTITFTPARTPQGVHSVTAAFQLRGEPQPGVYSYDNCTDCTATVALDNGAVFLSQKQGHRGSASLRIVSATRLFPTPEGTIYAVHGEIEADMPQQAPASGHDWVRMQVTF